MKRSARVVVVGGGVGGCSILYWLTKLGWDDVVRAHWVKNPLALLKRSVTAYWNFTRLLDWPIVKTFPFGVRFAFYYPGVSTILLPILFGVLLWLPLAAWLGWRWALLAAAAIGIAVAMFVVRKIQGFWLLRFIIFNDTLAEDRLEFHRGGGLGQHVEVEEE